MELLTKLRLSLEQLDEQDFKKYIVIALVCTGVLLGSLIYIYYSSVSSLKNRMSAINRNRENIQQLLERYDRVQKQKQYVEQILAKQPDYKIIDKFDQLLSRLGLDKHKSAPEDFSSEENKFDGYTEQRLTVTLSNIDMKQVAELLQAIEQEERIYTQKIEITKSGATLTVKITVATLEQEKKSQPATETE